VAGLTHRYPDRVLFLVTDKCSMYCRHCTRRRFAGQNDKQAPTDQIDKCIEYIENTPVEITPESTKACELLANAGVPLGNQSVLLRGINDNVHIMKELVQKLVKIRVRPYYIYQCDLSQGIEHFRTPVSKGIEIIEGLRGHTSGFAVPTFVVDAPGGGGKIPVMPQYLISQGSNRVVLRNFEGVITTYTEPSGYYEEKLEDEDADKNLIGVAGLLKGNQVALELKNLAREKRTHKE